ncbi:uncharacterized protein LOC120341593 [Styela clava]
MGLLRIGTGGGLVIAMIFNVVALATPGWIYTTSFSVGLFKRKVGDATLDVNRGDAEKVCIAFNVMGDAILLCGAIAALIAGREEGKEVIGKVGAALSLLQVFWNYYSDLSIRANATIFLKTDGYTREFLTTVQ